ncbi:hypothetical protein ACFC0M_10460 [Streptomyces sp. NPDC056149]|uniref:hypothetical protein n=1 Tax=Streptomyces sp. NPDC056149 TaxID=3345728 RepID=UPI0035D8A08C
MINACVTDLPLVEAEFGLTSGSGQPDSRLIATIESAQAAFDAERAAITSTSLEIYRRAWPVCPSITVLHAAAEPVLRQWVTTAVECLQQVVRSYPRDAQVQDLLAVPAPLHRWVMECPEPHRLRVDFCRLDLLGDTLGTTKVLEFNASGPGAALSFGMLNRLWRQSDLGTELEGTARTPFEHPEWFADWLIDYGRRRGLSEEDTQDIGIFHNARSAAHEFGIMDAQLRRRGRTPLVLRPDEVGRADELRLGYFKYIPHDFHEPTKWDDFCSRVTSGSLVIPNVLAERFIAENKLCLAVLSDPRFRHLFTPAQAAALDALVPYSRKLGDGITCAEAIAAREQLVLKAPYGSRGQQIVIGTHTAAAEWESAVRAPQHQGWLVQQRVNVPTVPAEQGHYFRDLVVPVLDGQVIGYGSRLSADPVMNVARGGKMAAVFAPISTT